jgi:cholesterol transport system auxiliary component
MISFLRGRAPGEARAVLRFAGAGVLALGLAGCVSLLPKSEPAQLYRFGVPGGTAPARPDSVGVFRANDFFQREAAGDRILTITGPRAAYIADARWVAPAEVLFEEAVANAFEAGSGRVRLVARGEPARSAYSLRLDVRNFETEYGADGTPTVLVRIRALMSGDQRQTPLAEQIFEARVPAAENRVTAIVAAYDAALAKVLGEIVAWANATVT